MFETLTWLGILAGLMMAGLPLAVWSPRASVILLPFMAGASLKTARAWASCMARVAAPSYHAPFAAPRRRSPAIMPRIRVRRVLTPLDICTS